MNCVYNTQSDQVVWLEIETGRYIHARHIHTHQITGCERRPAHNAANISCSLHSWCGTRSFSRSYSPNMVGILTMSEPFTSHTILACSFVQVKVERIPIDAGMDSIRFVRLFACVCVCLRGKICISSFESSTIISIPFNFARKNKPPAPETETEYKIKMTSIDYYISGCSLLYIHRILMSIDWLRLFVTLGWLFICPWMHMYSDKQTETPITPIIVRSLRLLWLEFFLSFWREKSSSRMMVRRLLLVFFVCHSIVQLALFNERISFIRSKSSFLHCENAVVNNERMKPK